MARRSSSGPRIRVGSEATRLPGESSTRPGLAQIMPEEARDDTELRREFDQLDANIEK